MTRKLTEKEVEQIRRARLLGHKKLRELSKEYGISITMVWKIVNSRTWKDSGQVTCPHCHNHIR